MTVIDFADSSLADYFSARDHLIAVGLRRGYELGNTRHCPGCETPVHPQTLACACFTPTRKDT